MIKTVSCVSERCQRVQAQKLSLHRKGNDEKSTEHSIEPIRWGTLPPAGIGGHVARAAYTLPSALILLNITNHQALD